MKPKGFTIALLCVVLYSLRSDASNVSNSSPSSENDTSEIIHQRTISDPFMLVGDDNILGPPRRRQVIRRTRRRRIKKLKTTPEPNSSSSSAQDSNFNYPTGSSTSTENVRMPLANNNNGRGGRISLAVVPLPLDFSMSVPEDMSASIPLPDTDPPPTEQSRVHHNPMLKPGHYVESSRPSRRRRPQSKENLWKSPNFSVDLFDTDVTEEDNVNSNVDKRESAGENKKPEQTTRTNSNSNNMFTSKPNKLSNLTDMNSEESTNPFINTSLPISTELQNSLQFTLQVLHPLLNSDTVLTQREPKIPENKTVAVTHTLSNTVAKTPIAPDLRFLPTQLRKKHPLLSHDSMINSDSITKSGPRVHIHSISDFSDHPILRPTITTTTTTERNIPFHNRNRFTHPPSTSSTTKRPVPVVTTTRTTTTSTTTPSSTPTTTTRRVPSSIPSVFKQTTSTKVPNVHTPEESPGNLKITEIVYPTGVYKPPEVTNSQGIDLIQRPTLKPHTTTKATSPSTTTTKHTTTRTTTSTRGSAIVKPTRYETYDTRSPPLILLGSDSNVSENKGMMDGPPAFDDLLLEELVKGFLPPTTTTSTSTTTTRTTTTTRPPTSTYSTTTPTPKTTTTSTSEPPKLSLDDETNNLLQLLNIFQQQQAPLQTTSTTEGFQIPFSSSSSTTTASSIASTSTPGKIDDLLHNLSLLDSLLSPTAKTMIKEAVDAGSTENIRTAKPATTGNGNGNEGLTDADLKAIYAMLDAMSTTEKPTTTTTPKPSVHPALQGMLTMLTNPWSEIQQKLKAQQTAQILLGSQPTVSAPVASQQPPQLPKPVPTTSSFDLLSQLFNLSPQLTQTESPKVNNVANDLGLASLFGNLLPKKQPNNREAGTASASGSNNLFNFFQPERPPTVSTPAPGPYYWFDVNAFLGNDPNAAMSGFRPKFGTRDYFLKVRRRRHSMERY